MTMTMETFYACRKLFRQLLGEHTKPAAWCTGVIKLSLYLTVFWVDTKPTRHRMLGEMGDF